MHPFEPERDERHSLPSTCQLDDIISILVYIVIAPLWMRISFLLDSTFGRVSPSRSSSRTVEETHQISRLFHHIQDRSAEAVEVDRFRLSADMASKMATVDRTRSFRIASY